MPAGTNPELLDWRLHWSPDGGLAVDAEAVTGGSVADLDYDADGLPAAVTAAHPELKGYLALRLSDKVARKAGDILRGQVAVALYDNGGALLDATGVQTAYVLDSLYAGRASTRAYGATFGGGAPAYRLWAPTAQKVSLLTWPAGAAADAPVTEATRTRMERAGDGSWSARRRAPRTRGTSTR